MIPPTRSRYIPLDVIEKIFLKLPAKSIIRFRSVCKTWCDLLKSFRFAMLHLSGTEYQGVVQISMDKMENSGGEVFSLHARMSKEVLRPENNISILNPDNTWSNWFELEEVSKRSFDPGFLLVGNCNGIVCVADNTRIVLINPSLRERKEIPGWSGQRWCHLVGLGFDHLTNDFKIVSIVDTLIKTQGRARVYSLSTNSWTEVGDIPMEFSIAKRFATYFNGFLHWCVGRVDLSGRILTFNTSTHVIRQLKLPQTAKILGVARLLVLKQKLVAFLSTTNASLRNTNQLVDIWVMKEYGVEESWTKLYSVGPLENIIEPVSFWEEDKLLLRTQDEKLVLYDRLQHQGSGLINLWVDSTLGSPKRFSLPLGFSVCKESLVSFSGM